MQLFINILGILGVWGLFSFPLYQAFLELSEQAITFTQHINIEKNFKKISPWLWLFPPLKISREKKRALSIIHEITLSDDEAKNMMTYFDKATAWFYVATAGLFNAIYFSYDLYKESSFNQSPILFILFLIFMTIFSILNVVYRMNPKRLDKKSQKLRK
ncbi:hypothetical protein BW731_04480 [Vagococcus martis]|uniref:Glycosyl-4,4'-diaponeurosporenoate acyltransferase n=1 Tax=Vagococcus martis TaxID=1768210 RepID=A0A1V4DG26_9ENTE|nr:hypothetical protein [Vagococcus martis]OPF87509.1 hypothetical protein BW731_04480 [Vagococcus martis]